MKPNPTMHPCTTSSQVKAHGHCAATNTLCIEFQSGGTYNYQDVTADQYAELCKCESVGKYLGSNIKGAHKYSKAEKDGD